MVKTTGVGERGTNPVRMTLSVLGKYFGRVGDRTLSSSPIRYRLSYETQQKLLNDSLMVGTAILNILSFNYANIHAISPMIYYF